MIECRNLEPDRRKHDRVPRAAAPLTLEVGAARLGAGDWSAGGARVDEVPPGAFAADEVAVRLRGPGGSLLADTRVRVVWQEAGAVGLAFDALSQVARERLDALARAALGPPLAATADAEPTAPPAGTGEHREAPREAAPGGGGGPGAGAPVRIGDPGRVDAPPRATWRPPVRTLLYAFVGLLLTLYVAAALYRTVWRIEVDAASLVAARARIASPADGELADVPFRRGDAVTAGAPIFRVDAPAAQAAVEEAAEAVARARVELERLTALRESWKTRLAHQARVLQARVASHRAQVGLLGERLGYAKDQLTRMEQLEGEKMLSPFEVHDMRARRAILNGELEAARSELTTDQVRLGAVRDGLYVDGDRVEDGLGAVEAALAAATQELALQEGHLAAEQRRAEALQTARAPFSGRVAEVFQAAGTPVRQGNVVLVVERADEWVVEAWLTREEALYVRLGAPAEVVVPGLGRTYDGVVRSIETEAASSVQAAQAGEAPRLRVLVDLVGFRGEPDSTEAVLAELGEVRSIGLPAIVSFGRSWR